MRTFGLMSATIVRLAGEIRRRRCFPPHAISTSNIRRGIFKTSQGSSQSDAYSGLNALFAPGRKPTPVTAASAGRTAGERSLNWPIAAAAQLFEDPDQRQLCTSRFSRVCRQQPVKLYCPSSQLWPRLHLPLVFEGGLRARTISESHRSK